MGVTKSTLFTEEHNKIAALAKAIGHPARVAIIEYLLNKEGCVCGDIVAELPLSQSTVSQHLKALKEAGIVKGEIDGAYRCYCLNYDVIEFFKQKMNDFFKINIRCC